MRLRPSRRSAGRVQRRGGLAQPAAVLPDHGVLRRVDAADLPGAVPVLRPLRRRDAAADAAVLRHPGHRPRLERALRRAAAIRRPADDGRSVPDAWACASWCESRWGWDWRSSTRALPE